MSFVLLLLCVFGEIGIWTQSVTLWVYLFNCSSCLFNRGLAEQLCVLIYQLHAWYNVAKRRMWLDSTGATQPLPLGPVYL